MIDFLRKIWELARPYKVRLFLGAFTGILTGAVSPLLIGTAMLIYGAIFPTENEKDKDPSSLPVKFVPQFVQDWYYNVHTALSHGLHEHRGAVWILIALIPIISLVRGITGYLNVYFLQWVGTRAVTDLRAKLFAHLMNLSAGFYSKNSTGELVSRVMNDTQALQIILTNVTSIIFRDPVMLVGTLAFLVIQQPRLTLLSLIILPACILPIAIYSRKIRRSSGAAQSQLVELVQTMTESFTGYRVIKAYNLEKIVTDRFREIAKRSVNLVMRITRASEMPSMLIEFFGACGIALMLAYLVFYSGGQQLKPTDFMQLIGSLLFIYQPLKNLTRLQNQVVQARAATQRVFEMLALTNSVPEPVAPKMLHADKADIIFENVDFNYGDKPVLRNINLTVKAGQLVALVGASGSGKTTMANLLLRFYDPVHGAIKIGGVDLRDVQTNDLRNQIAVVSQENILFNDTVRRNIELGRLGATIEEITAAAKFAKADEFILEKAKGFDSIVGEKGSMLSGGQRQRIAIARAVLRNAPILILDEALNALDPEVERQVQGELDLLMKDRTTLCIAHRLSTVIHADLIVVMNEGRIAEQGRHDDLIKQGGIYQKLYTLFVS
ncbi:MAG TPA: ABC transporter ATP-binding protein [Verrucomicrobiae bacterium]|nr:ABC transporter ATP-binding protein [Verrucomicrobiae bacterium]